MSSLAALVAFLKSIPALARFGEWLGETLKAYDQKRNEADAAKRLGEKDAAVDSRIDDAIRVHSRPPEQRGKTDGAP